MHASEGVQPFFDYPRIWGHEFAGEMVEIDGAPGFSIGETIFFISYFNCDTCIACRIGKPNCCTNIKVCGVHQDGGMVEYPTVPSSTLIHGNGLSFDDLTTSRAIGNWCAWY